MLWELNHMEKSSEKRIDNTKKQPRKETVSIKKDNCSFKFGHFTPHCQVTRVWTSRTSCLRRTWLWAPTEINKLAASPCPVKFSLTIHNYDKVFMFCPSVIQKVLKKCNLLQQTYVTLLRRYRGDTLHFFRRFVFATFCFCFCDIFVFLTLCFCSLNFVSREIKKS